MSFYPYSLLPPDGDNIRLLRLLPNEDKDAPLYCELRNYSLQRSSLRTHLYEALSYVWGDRDHTLSICVDKNQFQVTVNLYSALLRLRDHSFERIIWVDAICINQSNVEERKQQVQIMAKIYSNAHRVIVWLGEQTVEIQGALEVIQLAANEELTERSKKETKQQAILNLLQNPWFQRIWVLQEVAAARHIVIMCGSATIDGYAFCLGVKSLKLSYTASPEFQTLPSVIYLIERAGLRSKYTANLPERFSLEIRSLAELIDMFHTRQATDTRDKVYALLGMSSDDPEKAGLQPCYQISWEELFQQVVKFVLGKDISVNTSSQGTVIKCKGSILGQVSSVSRDDRQRVTITVRNAAWDLGSKIEWTLQASAKPIQENDIICLLRGALKPTIIRLYKDHFAIIMIAATPLDGDSSFRWPATFYLTTQFCRDFLLVWDWEDPKDKSQDQEKYKILTKIYSQALGYSKVEVGDYLHEATRFWNDIMILDDLGEYETAEERLVQARSGYARALGKELLPKLWGRGRTLLSFAAGEGHDDIVRLLLEKGAGIEVKDGKYSFIPLLWAAENGHEAVVKLLLEKGAEIEAEGNEFGETSLSLAARNGYEAVVKLLLEKGAGIEVKDREYGYTPLLWAAGGGHEAVVKLLLEKGAEIEAEGNEFGETSLSLAARNGYEAVVKLLLEKGAGIEVKDREYSYKPLLWAAGRGHKAVVKLLLEKGLG